MTDPTVIVQWVSLWLAVIWITYAWASLWPEMMLSSHSVRVTKIVNGLENMRRETETTAKEREIIDDLLLMALAQIVVGRKIRFPTATLLWFLATHKITEEEANNPLARANEHIGSLPTGERKRKLKDIAGVVGIEGVAMFILPSLTATLLSIALLWLVFSWAIISTLWSSTTATFDSVFGQIKSAPFVFAEEERQTKIAA